MQNASKSTVDFGSLEYRIKRVTRYVVTRYERGPGGDSGSVRDRGTYDNPDVAWEVAYALCKADHERYGYPLDDPRIQYPSHPDKSDGRRDVSEPQNSK